MLWVINEGGWQRRVPVIYEREPLTREALQNLGYPNGHALYEGLRVRFYWPGMRALCLQLAAEALPSRKEAAVFKPPPYLHTTNKMGAPFRFWCVDTIVGLTPPAPDGGTAVFVAVDPFIRWVEIGRTASLTSFHAAEWFHEQVVCRYGTPYGVRTDKGSEYRGEFDRYLTSQGIVHRVISTMHPRANGMVERFIRTIKATIRKFLAACEGAVWWQVL